MSDAISLPTHKQPWKYRDTALKVGVPILMVFALLAIWQIIVTVKEIPPYILPGPALVAQAHQY